MTRRDVLAMLAALAAPLPLAGCGTTGRAVPGTGVTLRAGPMQGRLLARAEDDLLAVRTALVEPFGPPPTAPLDVRLVGSFSTPAGPGAAARYLPGERAIEVRLGDGPDPLGDARDFRACIWHEYVHFVLHERAGGEALPAWFDEGVAEYFGRYGSGVAWRPDSRAGDFLGAIRTGCVPRLAEVDRLFYATDHARAYTAYAFAYSVAALLVARYGPSAPASMAGAVRRRYTIGGALRRLYGARLADFEAEWQASLVARYAA